MNIKVIFYDSKPYDELSFNRTNKSYGFDFTFLKTRLNKNTAALSKGFDVVCAFVNDEISSEAAEILADNGIKLIVLRSAGYNNVDLKSVFKRIHVLRVPAYSPYAVAEHAVALMLALNRKTHRAYYRVRDNNFNIDGLLGFDMNGKTAGVIGTGKIGRILIKILHGFGMKILAFDSYHDKEFSDKYDVEYVDLQTLYKSSDIISLHCPLTAETKHMINTKSIETMKPGVMIINTGRGSLVNSADLIEGLKSGRIGSAGLDVYEEEADYFFEDYSSATIEDDILARLMTFHNVLITSHQAFFTGEALNNIAETTLENIKAFAEDKPLVNEICYKCDLGFCAKEKYGRCF